MTVLSGAINSINSISSIGGDIETLKAEGWKVSFSNGKWVLTEEGGSKVTVTVSNDEKSYEVEVQPSRYASRELICEGVLPKLGFGREAIEEAISGKKVTLKTSAKEFEDNIKEAGIQLDELPEEYIKTFKNGKMFCQNGLHEFTIAYDAITKVASIQGTDRDVFPRLGVARNASLTASSYEFKDGKNIGFDGKEFSEWYDTPSAVTESKENVELSAVPSLPPQAPVLPGSRVYVPYRDVRNNIWYVPFQKAELQKMATVSPDGPATNLVKLESGKEVFDIPTSVLQRAINEKVTQKQYQTASQVVQNKKTDAVVTRTDTKRDYYGMYAEKIGKITQKTVWRYDWRGCPYQCTVTTPQVTVERPNPQAYVANVTTPRVQYSTPSPRVGIFGIRRRCVR